MHLLRFLVRAREESPVHTYRNADVIAIGARAIFIPKALERSYHNI